METYKTAPTLEQAIQQQSHHDRLTVLQVENAKGMGIKGITTDNTNYDLLKQIRFQNERPRHTSNYVKHLVKSRGRKRAKIVLNKAFDKYGHI
jgi:hypothetical protein